MPIKSALMLKKVQTWKKTGRLYLPKYWHKIGSADCCRWCCYDNCCCWCFCCCFCCCCCCCHHHLFVFFVVSGGGCGDAAADATVVVVVVVIFVVFVVILVLEVLTFFCNFSIPSFGQNLSSFPISAVQFSNRIIMVYLWNLLDIHHSSCKMYTLHCILRHAKCWNVTPLTWKIYNISAFYRFSYLNYNFESFIY